MDRIKILLVEDDESYAFMMKSSLDVIGGYDICTAYDGKEGLDLYKSFNPDIIVSDIDMPIMNGKDMVRSIREKDSYTPVIFLTSYKESKDFIDGIKIGADAYMRKPIIGDELDAQVRALLKRVSFKPLPLAGAGESLIGTFGFNASNKYLVRKGKMVDLTKTEAKILELLVAKKGHMVMRRSILKYFENNNNMMSSRTLDVHIFNLRAKMSEDPSVEIVTVHKEGYILKDGF